jgi:hypothetical protein
MRAFLILVAVVLLSGCGYRKSYLQDDVDDINRLAFAGKVDVHVTYCQRYQHPGCWKHHGLYVLATHDIHISPEWAWEPHWYHMGVIAHEMIHAYLHQTDQEASESTCHSWLFRKERDRVALALSIPVWAIPDGKRIDKLDATRKMAWLEAYQQAQIDAVHGICRRETGGAGWPTQLYDPD